MRILLQFPEGLKQHALKYAKKLEARDNEIFISCSPTYGACDIAIDEARAIGAEKIIHFGHAEFAPDMQKLEFPVEYIEYKITVSLSILEDSLQNLKEFNSIALITTVQHIDQIQDIKHFYEKNGKKINIGRPNAFAKYDGQILGCDSGSVNSVEDSSDCIVYFGGGMFHPISALLSTKKPFFAIDPFLHKIQNLDFLRDKYKKRSRGKIMQALSASKFGIIASTKNGQMQLTTANVIETAIKNNGLYAKILITNNIDFDSLNNLLEFDAFVNTACPRISEDNERIRKPLLNANELYEVLRLKKELETK